MSVLFVILPVALVLGGVFLLAFLWAVRGGQFDDVETPSVRLVLEDRPAGRVRASAASENGAEEPREAKEPKETRR